MKHNYTMLKNTCAKVLVAVGIITNTLSANAQCWKSISVSDQDGNIVTAAIQNNGTLWVWGAGYDSIPKQMGTNTDWAVIDVVTTYEGAAIKTNGTLWLWNNCKLDTIPTQLGVATNWKSVAGYLGLKTDGTLWTLGNTQIGTGTNWKTTTNNIYVDWGIKTNGTLWKTNPETQIGLANNWKDVGLNFAIKTDGTLWEYNYNLNTTTQVGAATNWDKISGQYALKTNGTLWSLYDAVFALNPNQIGSSNNWAELNANYAGYSGVLLDNQNTLWTFGNNTWGNIGDGTFINRSTPVQIGSACVATSIETDRISNIIAYPNPTTGVVTITLPTNEVAHYQVLNNLGQVIINGNNTIIDLSSYANGTCTLRVISSTGVSTQRIIKQ